MNLHGTVRWSVFKTNYFKQLRIESNFHTKPYLFHCLYLSCAFRQQFLPPAVCVYFPSKTQVCLATKDYI